MRTVHNDEKLRAGLGNIVCVDPGTANTGFVYMSPYHVLCCKTYHGASIKFDQYDLKERAGDIARCMLSWIADKPHDAIVIEGFVGFSKQQSAYTYQTPYLLGYLHRALEHAGEEVVIQTSRQVLNPKSKGAVVSKKDKDSPYDTKQAALMRSGWGDIHKCTNDHLRAAALHGVYYYTRKGEET